MAKILTLEQAQKLPYGQMRDWAYNALDVTGTREIADVILPQLSETQMRTYEFDLGIQAPAMAMMLRGVKVDVEKRKEAVKELKKELKKDLKSIGLMHVVQDIWDGTELETGTCSKAPEHLKLRKHKWPRGVPDEERSCERCGKPRIKKSIYNPNSADQNIHLFYDLFGIPPMKNKQRKVSVDKEILPRIAKKYPQYKDLCDAILDVKDKKKQLGTLNAKLGPNNRFYSSFNVGAAWTDRFSSSKNPYGLGGNLQNVPPRHRNVFIADTGYDMAYIDLMQAESNVVAHISGDEAYIEAHNSGDVHTYATRLIWTHLPWTGDLKKDKVIAKTNPPWDQAPGHNYRFQAKRVQHGSNYGLTPYGISMIAKIPMAEAKKAYNSYFDAFPGIKDWHNKMKVKINNHEPIVNIFGDEIILLGRPWDGHTFKQGLAYIPQSSVAKLLNLAMWRVWNEHDPETMQLLAQVHDAILAQYPEGRLDILKKVIMLMEIPIPVNGRIMKIGVEAAYGKNWGKKSENNPNGLVEI